MSIAPENDATTWRDIADQLTLEQIQDLLEQDPPTMRLVIADDGTASVQPPPLDEQRQHLLREARRYARENLRKALIGDVALPPGAASADSWQEAQPQPYRIVWGADRRVDGRLPGFEHNNVVVSTAAIQFADGTLDDGTRGVQPPTVHVNNNDVQAITAITASHARELAAALIAAADEIDGWGAL